MRNYRTPNNLEKRTASYNILVDARNEIIPLIQNLLNKAKIQKNGYPHKSIQDKIQETVNNVRTKYNLHYLTVKYTVYSISIDLSYCYQIDETSCNHIKDYVYIADIGVDNQIVDIFNYPFTPKEKISYETILEQKKIIEENRKIIDILEGEISKIIYQTSIFKDE